MAERLFQATAGRGEGKWNGSPCKLQPTKSGWLFTRQPSLCLGCLLMSHLDQTTFSIFSQSHTMGRGRIVVTESESLGWALGSSNLLSGWLGANNTTFPSPTLLSYKMAVIIVPSQEGYKGH